MTPGPIALNAATFVGTKVAGLPGAIIATLGCITPSCIIVLILSYFYFKYKNLNSIQGILKGIRPAVVSLIASAGLSIFALAVFKNENINLFNFNINDINIISVIIIVVSLFFLRKFKVNPMHIIIVTGIAGIIIKSI
jgi:chromate transporter